MRHWIRFGCALAALAGIAACSHADPAISPGQLGIATPAHPVSNTARLEAMPGEPMEMPVPSPAVPRATDAGSNDEGAPLEPRPGP
jgi:hypothetical protein